MRAASRLGLEGILKIRHYVLLIFTLAIIAFCQPLILLLGGVTLLGGALAFIYADLPPASQQAWEAKLIGWLKQAQQSLSRPAQPAPASAPLVDARRRNGRMTRDRHPALDDVELSSSSDSTGAP